jgi:hypothetical protein
MPNSYYYHRYGHESDWIRWSKKNNVSIAATQVIAPIMDFISVEDRNYILGDGKETWFDDLEKRPITLVDELKNNFSFAVTCWQDFKYSTVLDKSLQDTANKIKESDRFNYLAQSFLTKYNKIKSHSINPNLILPVWDEWNKTLEANILPIPPISFLKTPVIMQTMFVGYDKFYSHEISFLETELSPDKLKYFLREDSIGEPPITTEYQEVLTSYNTVHHLHHLVKFFANTKCSPRDINCVVEWGGGYGNLAKLFKRMKGNENLTYIIIDTPLFSCIQWLYLGSIWGEDKVNLIDDLSKSLVEGKINLLPLTFLDNYPISNDVDLFISTWALSECSDVAQNYVVNHQWFNAKHFLLAYHLGSGGDFPFTSKVCEIATSDGATTVDIDFLPGHQYAFR